MKNKDTNLPVYILFFIFLLYQLPYIFNFEIEKYEYIVVVIGFIISTIYWVVLTDRKLSVYTLTGILVFVCVQIAVISYAEAVAGYESNIFAVLAVMLNFLTYFLYLQKYSISCRGILIFLRMYVIYNNIMCLINIVLNYQNILSLKLGDDPYSVAFASVYGQRNTFASYLWVSICMASYLWIISRKKTVILSIVFQLVNLFFTFSRASILSTAVFALVLMCLAWRKLRRMRTFFVLTSAAALCVTAFLFTRYNSLLSEYLIRSDFGNAGRSEVWEASIKGIGIAPLFGCGFGIQDQVLSHTGATSCHNAILEAVLTGGILLLVLIICFFISSWRAVNYISKQDLAYSTVMKAFLISSLFHKLFESDLIFALGGRNAIETVLFITLPIMYSNYIYKENTE